MPGRLGLHRQRSSQRSRRQRLRISSGGALSSHQARGSLQHRTQAARPVEVVEAQHLPSQHEVVLQPQGVDELQEVLCRPWLPHRELDHGESSARGPVSAMEESVSWTPHQIGRGQGPLKASLLPDFVLALSRLVHHHHHDLAAFPREEMVLAPPNQHAVQLPPWPFAIWGGWFS